MVVIAGNHDDLADRLPELAEHGRRLAQRLAQRTMSQLEHVAEQHQAINAGQRRHECRALALAAQYVRASAGAQMQIGDDEGAQAGDGA